MIHCSKPLGEKLTKLFEFSWLFNIFLITWQNSICLNLSSTFWIPDLNVGVSSPFYLFIYLNSFDPAHSPDIKTDLGMQYLLRIGLFRGTYCGWPEWICHINNIKTYFKMFKYLKTWYILTIYRVLLVLHSSLKNASQNPNNFIFLFNSFRNFFQLNIWILRVNAITRTLMIQMCWYSCPNIHHL